MLHKYVTVPPVTKAVYYEWQSCIPYCLLRNVTWLFGFVFLFWLLFKSQFQWSIFFFIYWFKLLSCIRISMLWTDVQRPFWCKLLHYHILKYIGFQILKIPKHKMIHRYAWALLRAKLAVLIPYPLFTSLRGLKGRWNFVFRDCCSTLSV